MDTEAATVGIQEHAAEIEAGMPLHLPTNLGRPVDAVLTVVVYVAQNAPAANDDFSS